MSNHVTEPEPDTNLAIADDLPMPDVEAPRGMEWNEEHEGALVNAIPADEFLIEEGVEGLLWLGYLNDTFPMYGHMFTIRTLTRGERLACTLVAKEWEETLGMAAAYETATVAAALQFVDGQPFLPQLQQNDPQNRIREGFLTVQKWYEPLVVALARKVGVLHFRQQEAFNELESKS